MILVVEDDRVNRELMVAALEPLGHEVVVCASGEEALRSIASRSPDLIFTDRSLPGIDGLELIRRVRADDRRRDVPVVMVAGDASEEAAQIARTAGADAYLAKPASISALLAVARRFLGEVP